MRTPRFDSAQAGAVPDVSRRGLLSLGGLTAIALAGMGAGGTTGALWKGVAEPMAGRIIAGDLDIVQGESSAYLVPMYKPGTNTHFTPDQYDDSYQKYDTEDRLSWDYYKVGEKHVETRGFHNIFWSNQILWLTDIDIVAEGDNIEASMSPQIVLDPRPTENGFEEGNQDWAQVISSWYKPYTYYEELVETMPKLENVRIGLYERVEHPDQIPFKHFIGEVRQPPKTPYNEEGLVQKDGIEPGADDTMFRRIIGFQPDLEDPSSFKVSPDKSLYAESNGFDIRTDGTIMVPKGTTRMTLVTSVPRARELYAPMNHGNKITWGRAVSTRLNLQQTRGER